MDYQALNKVTNPDKFLILVMEELLDDLHGAKLFSKIASSPATKVRVREEDIHKTTFSTHEGHYEFLDILLGLMHAPSIF